MSLSVFKKRLRVGVDTGGTFTDLVVLSDDGQLLRSKVLSTPDDFSRGIFNALQSVFDQHGIDATDLAELIHGTTVATNAVIEGTGPTIGLITTRGFRDVLEIGRCRWDGNIFDLSWKKAPCLVPRHLRREVDERISADGKIVRALDAGQARDEIRMLRTQGVTTVAVCLMNSYANPEHERRIREIAAVEAPEMVLCTSTDVLAEIREFERASTTSINAYLVPVVDSYLTQLQGVLTRLGYAGGVRIMQSNGGIMSAEAARRRPVHIVESGPAAGVLACSYLARQTGEDNLIVFDMGGTSAKASLIEKTRWFESLEYHVGGGMNRATGGPGGGHVLRVPSIEIAEVGAGGGSIARIDEGGLLKVGPRSAGAAPGPVCYDLGGSEPTVTDAYAVLGYLNPNAIAGGAKKIVHAKAHDAIKSKIADLLDLSMEEAAHAIYMVATANIIRAVRTVTVERGRDAREYALVAFGGAGPMHAAELARSMGLSRVIVPSCSGLFSALGLLMADIEQDYTRTVLSSLATIDAADVERLNEGFLSLERQARSEFDEEHAFGELRVDRSITMHYVGQSHELVLDAPSGTLAANDIRKLGAIFCAEHKRAYGYNEDVSRVQVVSVRVKARCLIDTPSYADIGRQAAAERPAMRQQRARDAYFGARYGWVRTPLFSREEVPVSGAAGPAIIEELDTTIVVPPDVTFALDDFGSVVMTLAAHAEDRKSLNELDISAMSLELVNNGLNSITDEMATILTRTARSLGIRDAHDFSIAICTPQGELVSGGVGLAIHLGAIPAALAAVRTKFRDDVAAGDIFFMNDPYSGGMHLPDIFLIKPLVLDNRLLGYAAVVAHMEDIGGRVPGGNAADSTSIYQEGLRIPPMKLYRRGELVDSCFTLVRANVRRGDTVIGDILAEVAACNTAEREFFAMARRIGPDRLLMHMQELINYGERMARAALRSCQAGQYGFTDYLDDDGLGGDRVKVQVSIDITGDRIRVDLTGTSPQVRGAINAPLAITQSTIAFVVKAILGRDLPNNSGFNRIIELVVPEGTIANMSFPSACAARAVTAYRIMDALFGALAEAMPDRIPAAGDGGPAIISVGGDDEHGDPFVFMEVLSGAFGARPTADGLEGVASPIANTQNTSSEMIEANLPLRVEQYGFVPDTGGAGRYRGGLAVRRDIRFLGRRAVLQIRAERARIEPWGLAGGLPGSRSENTLQSTGEAMRRLPGKTVVDIQHDDLWSHTTASGGGWGPPEARDPRAIEHDIKEGKMTRRRAKELYPSEPGVAKGDALAE